MGARISPPQPVLRSLKPFLFACLIFTPPFRSARALETPEHDPVADGAPLLKTIEIPSDGPGYHKSHPRVYLAADTLFYENGCWGSPLMALDTADFAHLWQRPAIERRVGGIAFGAHAEGKVFVTMHMSNLLCLDAHSGVLRWETVEPSMQCRRVLVEGSTVLTVGWGTVRGFDKSSGEHLWKIRFDLPANRIAEHTTHDAGRSDGEPVVYWGIGGKVYALGVATGRILWTLVVDEAETLFSTGHLSDGDTGLGNELRRAGDGIVLFHNTIAKRDSTLYAVDVQRRAVLWNRKERINSFRREGDEVFLANGPYPRRVTCLDARTGAEKWHYDTSKTRTGPVAIFDGVVYCCENWIQDRTYVAMACLHAVRRADGAPLWRFITEGWYREPPVIHDGRLIVVSPKKGTSGPEGILYMFDHEKTARDASSDTAVAPGRALR